MTAERAQDPSNETPAASPASDLLIITADNQEVYEGDRVFSHYTCTWGVIRNAHNWAGDGVWFDFVDEDTGKRSLLNGERICTKKPAWMS